MIDSGRTRVKTVATKGAAHVHTKTVQEMAQEREQARANAAAADEGKMTKEPAAH